MHYFLFADKDTTIYQASSSLNAGLDEILEVKKDVSDTGATVNSSRILMKFDLAYISSSGRKIYKVVDGKVSFGPELRGVNIGGKNFSHPGLRKDYCIILFTEDGVIVRSLDKIEENWKSG